MSGVSSELRLKRRGVHSFNCMMMTVNFAAQTALHGDVCVCAVVRFQRMTFRFTLNGPPAFSFGSP